AYNDWHRFNVIERRGKLVALIDYDSVVEAPRIVDVQNALTYVLLGTRTPDLRLANALLEGYAERIPLSPSETSLLYPVWLDQMAWLVADIVADERNTRASTRADL